MSLPFKVIDLTHTLSPTVPTWNGSCGFMQEIKLDYSDSKEITKFRVQKIKMHAGIGTHLDAPRHCFSSGKDIAELSLTQLIAPCIVINVSEKAHAHYSVSTEDLLSFEKYHILIPKGCFVIIYTGWEKFWTKPESYCNQYNFPSISKEAIIWLLDKDIVGIGIDTLSPDRPNEGFLVHHLVLGAGKYIVENVARAAELPSFGAYTFALPIKTAEGSEAPIRLVAVWNHE